MQQGMQLKKWIDTSRLITKASGMTVTNAMTGTDDVKRLPYRRLLSRIPMSVNRWGRDHNDCKLYWVVIACPQCGKLSTGGAYEKQSAMTFPGSTKELPQRLLPFEKLYFASGQSAMSFKVSITNGINDDHAISWCVGHEDRFETRHRPKLLWGRHWSYCLSCASPVAMST